MIRCTCTIVGISPISFSAPIASVKGGNETHDEFENRTWRERIHVDAKTGEAYMPPSAIKNCLTDIAAYLGEKIKGQRNATYTKRIKSGISVVSPLMFGVKADKIDSERLFVPSDGKPGGGSRVWKNFPYIPEWKADVEVIILDEIITPEKLCEFLEKAGLFIGVGRFRPARNGHYGRFKVENFKHDATPKVETPKKAAA